MKSTPVIVKIDAKIFQKNVASHLDTKTTKPFKSEPQKPPKLPKSKNLVL